MDLYLTGNPIAALQVFGKEYGLELTATQGPPKTQVRERKHMKDCLKVCSPSIPLEIVATSPGLSPVSKELSTVPHPSGPLFF